MLRRYSEYKKTKLVESLRQVETHTEAIDTLLEWMKIELVEKIKLPENLFESETFAFNEKYNLLARKDFEYHKDVIEAYVVYAKHALLPAVLMEAEAGIDLAAIEIEVDKMVDALAQEIMKTIAQNRNVSPSSPAAAATSASPSRSNDGGATTSGATGVPDKKAGFTPQHLQSADDGWGDDDGGSTLAPTGGKSSSGRGPSSPSPAGRSSGGPSPAGRSSGGPSPSRTSTSLPQHSPKYKGSRQEDGDTYHDYEVDPYSDPWEDRDIEGEDRNKPKGGFLNGLGRLAKHFTSPVWKRLKDYFWRGPQRAYKGVGTRWNPEYKAARQSQREKLGLGRDHHELEGNPLYENVQNTFLENADALMSILDTFKLKLKTYLRAVLKGMAPQAAAATATAAAPQAAKPVPGAPSMDTQPEVAPSPEDGGKSDWQYKPTEVPGEEADREENPLQRAGTAPAAASSEPSVDTTEDDEKLLSSMFSSLRGAGEKGAKLADSIENEIRRNATVEGGDESVKDYTLNGLRQHGADVVANAYYQSEYGEPMSSAIPPEAAAAVEEMPTKYRSKALNNVASLARVLKYFDITPEYDAESDTYKFASSLKRGAPVSGNTRSSGNPLGFSGKLRTILMRAIDRIPNLKHDEELQELMKNNSSYGTFYRNVIPHLDELLGTSGKSVEADWADNDLKQKLGIKSPDPLQRAGEVAPEAPAADEENPLQRAGTAPAAAPEAPAADAEPKPAEDLSGGTTEPPVEEPTAEAEPVEEPTAEAEPVEEPTAEAEPVEEPTAEAEPVEEPTAEAEPSPEMEKRKITSEEAVRDYKVDENEIKKTFEFSNLSIEPLSDEEISAIVQDENSGDDSATIREAIQSALAKKNGMTLKELLQKFNELPEYDDEEVEEPKKA